MLFSGLDPLSLLILLATLTGAITIHEFAHAWMADHLGDPTPRLQDRVTLNPLRHLDPIGTLTLLLTGFFGWGRPVEFDPYNLKNPRRDILLVSLAGPAVNLVVAVAIVFAFPFSWFIESEPTSTILKTILGVNLGLALFNLIPLHPLDGGKILSSLLPRELAHEYDQTLHQYGHWILLLLVLPLVNGQSAVSFLVRPVLFWVQVALFTAKAGLMRLF